MLCASKISIQKKVTTKSEFWKRLDSTYFGFRALSFVFKRSSQPSFASKIIMLFGIITLLFSFVLFVFCYIFFALGNWGLTILLLLSGIVALVLQYVIEEYGEVANTDEKNK